jgi:hypothetical protein
LSRRELPSIKLQQRIRGEPVDGEFPMNNRCQIGDIIDRGLSGT